MDKRKMTCGFLFFLFFTSTSFSSTNIWRGVNDKWDDPANWSSGQVPSGARHDQVVIRTIDTHVYPLLAENTQIGGCLTIGSGARLSLEGHSLEVGTATDSSLTGGTDGPCLKIEAGGILAGDKPGSGLILHSGGLVNAGRISGSPELRVQGNVSGFILDCGAISLSRFVINKSPFPYPVELSGSISLRGDLVLRGGRLVVKKGADTTLTVMGDLLFEGGTYPVMLVPEGEVAVRGTVKSDGSAYCVEIPGSDPVWDEQEEAGYCRLTQNPGWVRMIGAGDQEIVPGGILPPIAIDKQSGKVTITGDLQCGGLYVVSGSTLDLSKGQTLVFGHHLRELERYRPKGGGDPRPGYIRTSRDLMNEGRITGTPFVPVRFLFNMRGNKYSVECLYLQPEDAERHDPKLYATVPWAAPWSLSMNRYKSRLKITPEGVLLLDEKPYEPSAADEDNDDLDILSGIPGMSPATDKAVVKNVRMTISDEKFNPPERFSVNIAPMVERIITPARGSTVFNVQGPLWRDRDVYGSVDGDISTGTGGALFYDFVFSEPVTICAARLFSSTPLHEGCQFLIRAANDEGPWQVAAWTLGGSQTNESIWTALGESAVVFEPVTASRFRLEMLGPGGVRHAPSVNEFEIYASTETAERIAASAAGKPDAFSGDATILERGGHVSVEWSETSPENRVSKVVSTAFWMAGVTWGAGVDETVYEKLPHLRDHEGTLKLFDGVKKLGFDAMTIFFEGEGTGFPWPTVNFNSALNAGYLNRREVALKMRAVSEPEKTGDELLDIIAEVDSGGASGIMEVKEPENEKGEVYRKELKIEDLPFQRNLLREFSEAAHENGLEVSVVTRPEDMRHYIGEEGLDPYEIFLMECAAAGVDSVSIVPDEAHPLWAGTRTARWREFVERTKEARKTFTPEEEKRWILERAVIAGLCMKERMEHVRSIKPDIKFYVDGARLLNGGDPYDIIWGISDPDYTGCSYQSHLVPRWAATSPGRRVKMGSYPHRSVRYNLESVLLGAHAVRTYRYNYIELAESADYRARENRFIEEFMRWGGTRPARAPTALLVSRASEAWWPMDVRAERIPGENPERCWIVEEIVYEFLLKNGYTFDVYYLDRTDDLQALAGYGLVILPFAYSVPRAALEAMNDAYGAGANFLVFERQGDVDEFGVAYESPLLKDFITRGLKAGRAGFPEIDLLEMETVRSFSNEIQAIIDPLLGAHKDIVLKRYGNRIEAVVAAISPVEQYVSFINWENQDAMIEVELSFPEGRYKMLTLSSADPDVLREGLIAGRNTFTPDDLSGFGLKLTGDEVLSLYIISENKKWGDF